MVAVNYYPAAAQWDGPAYELDLRRAAALGFGIVRIFLQATAWDASDAVGAFNFERLSPRSSPGSGISAPGRRAPGSR